MKRLLPLIALSLLLLAPSAEAGELDILESQIKEVAVQIEHLLDRLEGTEHPQKRAELEAQVESARDHAKVLEGHRTRLRAELGQLKGKTQVLERQVEQALLRATAIHDQELMLVNALSKAEAAKEMNDQASAIQMATGLVQRAHQARDAMEDAKRRIELGELNEARDRVLMVQAMLDDYGAHMKSWQGQRQAWAAKRKAERVRRSEEAARIAETYERAKAALERAIASRAKLEFQLDEARLTAADEDIERLRGRIVDAEADRKRIEDARVWLDKARQQLDTKRYEEAKKAFEEAKKLLEGPPTVRIAYKDGKVTFVKRVTMTTGPEHTAARHRIRELEEKLADLRTRMTDRHPAVQEVTRELARARAHLDELDEKTEKQGPMPTIVTDGEGRFVIRGSVVDERGIPVPPPAPRIVVQRTDRGPARVRLDRHTDQEAKERIEHLRQAAHHLHEAGQHEQAETLEKEARELEESLNRYRLVITSGDLRPEVMEAIHGLRREIRQLREEVRELKELIRRESR